MANVYYSEQIVGDTSLQLKSLNCIEYSASHDDAIPDYQQWVAYPTDENDNLLTFNAGQSYLLKFDIKQNINYRLDYGIRLINIPLNLSAENWRSVTDYEFVKYITVPAVSSKAVTQSTVWLYQERATKNDEYIDLPVNAAVAVQFSKQEGVSIIESIQQQPPYGEPSQRANKFFYTIDSTSQVITHIYRYDANGNIISDDEDEPKDYIALIRFNSNQMLQQFDSEIAANGMTYYLIFTPTSDWNGIYFYLRFIAEDEDLRWVNDKNETFRGRHTIIENVKYIELNNILPSSIINNENNKIVNMGIWGRSEQLIAINGQELKIGPSGYFELKDFEIQSLCVANTTDTDKYVVDIQYKQENSD